MISRWPTMTFSTSARSAWKEAMNCSTRGSCVMRSPFGRGGRRRRGPHYMDAARAVQSPEYCKPSAKRCARVRSRRADRCDGAVHGEIALDFALRRKLRGHVSTSARSESRAEITVERQTTGHRFEVGDIAEEQTAHVVRNERAIACNVGSQHRPAARQRFEQRVGHATL